MALIRAYDETFKESTGHLLLWFQDKDIWSGNHPFPREVGQLFKLFTGWWHMYESMVRTKSLEIMFIALYMQNELNSKWCQWSEKENKCIVRSSSSSKWFWVELGRNLEGTKFEMQTKKLQFERFIFFLIYKSASWPFWWVSLGRSPSASRWRNYNRHIWVSQGKGWEKTLSRRQRQQNDNNFTIFPSFPRTAYTIFPSNIFSTLTDQSRSQQRFSVSRHEQDNGNVAPDVKLRQWLPLGAHIPTNLN